MKVYIEELEFEVIETTKAKDKFKTFEPGLTIIYFKLQIGKLTMQGNTKAKGITTKLDAEIHILNSLSEQK